MPDRDVYDRNVDRGWQTPSRHVYGGSDDDLTLPSLLRALGRTLKNGGCPGVDTVASIVAEAVGSAEPRLARREVGAQLEQVRRACGSARTEIAVVIARRILAEPDVLFPTPADCLDRDRVKEIVAKEILVELAIRKISTSALTHELVEKENKSIGHVLARRQHARELLTSAPQITGLAREVLASPEGQTIKIPRVKTPKPAQEEILVMAISS